MRLRDYVHPSWFVLIDWLRKQDDGRVGRLDPDVPVLIGDQLVDGRSVTWQRHGRKVAALLPITERPFGLADLHRPLVVPDSGVGRMIAMQARKLGTPVRIREAPVLDGVDEQRLETDAERVAEYERLTGIKLRQERRGMPSDGGA